MKTWLSRSSHWLSLAVVVTALAISGFERFHVRAFGTFILILLALTASVVAFIVRAYRPGDTITRESFEDSALPHQARGSEESEAVQ